MWLHSSFTQSRIRSYAKNNYFCTVRATKLCCFQRPCVRAMTVTLWIRAQGDAPLNTFAPTGVLSVRMVALATQLEPDVTVLLVTRAPTAKPVSACTLSIIKTTCKIFGKIKIIVCSRFGGLLCSEFKERLRGLWIIILQLLRRVEWTRAG